MKFTITFLFYLFLFSTLSMAEEVLSPEQRTFFEAKIRPIFVENCYKCHSKEAKKLKGNLLLDSKAGWMAGGEHGAVVIPHDVKNSLLIKAVSYEDKHLKMPPEGKKLSEQQIAYLQEWVRSGAPDPRRGDEEYVENRSKIDILKSQKSYWAFTRINSNSVAKVSQSSWSKHPIDSFIMAKLEEHQLVPNQSVNKEKLIRRLFFDLVGLPPSAEDIDSYLKDTRPEATSALIKRLLDSPHFGERWARHWMDVARFAESFGFEQDYDRPFAYYYRDFLIKAFNDDLPYNTFVEWQIAGDEIAPENPYANMATGFLAGGVFPTQLTENEFETARYDELDDVAGTVSTAFMGLTLSCARCHTHKYDPIPISDYYNFTAAFATTIRAIDHLKFEKDSPFLKAEIQNLEAQQKQLADYENNKLFPAYQKLWHKDDPKSFKQCPEELKASLEKEPKNLTIEEKTALMKWFMTIDGGYKKIQSEVKLIESNLKDHKARVMVMSEGLPHIPHHADGRGYPHFYENVHHLKRGNINNKEDVAQQGFLQVLTYNNKDASHWITPAPENSRTSHKRKALAKWMTDTENGAGELVARVMVNRLWQHTFGRGIVATSNDFGRQGLPPTHPELLDHLADKLIKSQWSVKALLHYILTSKAYAMSTDHNDQNHLIDPDNQYLWKKPVRRLEAEVIRDSMLKISETLNPELYGPGQHHTDNSRRSVYFFLKRSALIPMMRLFDMPSPLTGQGERQVTTIAPQALMFMNSSFIEQLARDFGKHLKPYQNDKHQLIDHAYRSVVGRRPNQNETQASLDYLSQFNTLDEALPLYAKALFSLNEFIYID